MFRQYLDGDNDAFSQLVQRYSRELYVFLVRFVNDADLAEDLVQETFLQAHSARDTYDTTRPFRPWLFTVAANKARDRLRFKQRRPETLVGNGTTDGGEESNTSLFDLLGSFQLTPELELESEETAARVRELMECMPPQLKEVLLMAYFQQFPYRDISEMLDIPVGTVKSRVHSAVKWFAEHWKDGNPVGR